ncbi:outer membrane beta-barrel protein [Formosa haliotis]|uniref:outer membrane beta-barrel protein n=1 Tax=Formosa haliotis TaxID=1555194 RepID=UPI000826F1B4|nr:outer membrane beta-barrel protein [Formosa haliotis]
MKSKYIWFFAMMVLSFSAMSQEKYSVNYSVGIPTGDTADFTESVSWRGVGFDYTHMLNQEWGVGISASLQTFYDDLGYVTTTEGKETVSANRYNYINSLPIYATGSYFINESADFTPFVSLGVGVMYNQKEQDLGLHVFEEEAWQFSLRPEVGFEYDVSYGLGLRAAARYNAAFKSGDLEGLSHFSIAVGVIWTN